MPSEDIFDDRAGEPATEIRNLTREQAIEYGRRLGEQTAKDMRESGNERVRRAMAYAAWDYDGRPVSSAPHREEFGVPSGDVVGFLEARP